jgi:hypothetical protein
MSRYFSRMFSFRVSDKMHAVSTHLPLINFISTKEELPDQWKESIIVPIYNMGVNTDCNNYRGIPLLSTSYKLLANTLRSMCRYVISVDFDVTDKLLKRASALIKYCRNNGSPMRQCFSYS